MHPAPTPALIRITAFAAGAGVLAAGAWGFLWHQRATQPLTNRQPAAQMLLAPMIGVMEPCVDQPPGQPGTPSSLTQRCAAPEGSAGALVEATLRQLDGGQPSRYTLGYTLAVPLLKLFKPSGGDWVIDQATVDRLVNTVRDVRRPVVLYLFSTHFEAQAPIEAALAQDSANMAWTQDGPLERDSYYGALIYDWSLATTGNGLTRRRVQAMRAVLDATCRLAPDERSRVRAVTLLGELHHLFPDFQAGMGFESPYRITDYSPASVQDFRAHLARQWGSIARLNRFLGSDYAAFDEVDPPSRDIRSQPLRRYTEHIDAFAHGWLPVSGWAHVAVPVPGHIPRVHVYLDGRPHGHAPVTLSRQDVLAARPEFATADTGWRLNLDFRRLPAGMHRLDLFLEDRPGHLVRLGERRVAIMDRQQSTPREQPLRGALPAAQPAAAGTEFHIDFPREQSAYYYNPLVPLWHDFRAQQVTRYLEFFDRQVAQSCLADVPRYTHQIIPFTNPGWDATRFAIEDSLRPHGTPRLGVSLYGEAAYGGSFAQWLRRSGQQRYGVTEFHPLKAMGPQELMQVLGTHARQGAQFLSFFLEPEWEGQRVPRGHNLFSFDPQNPQFGSDVLYRSVQQGLKR
ncbi:MAG TPA: hypothetical protein DIC45_14480 [Comamonadaceae bacterium]|nr:hypothetical protein [Comamonadaceae bacterium]